MAQLEIRLPSDVRKLIGWSIVDVHILMPAYVGLKWSKDNGNILTVGAGLFVSARDVLEEPKSVKGGDGAKI
jgi:hypothetical protein